MSAKKKTVITAQDILAKFMEYVLDKGRWPVSVYQFCKEAGFKEDEFYAHYGSVRAIKSSVWTFFYDHTAELLSGNKDYQDYNAKEKMLSFFYTFFELLGRNRSYMLFTLESARMEEKTRQLSGLRKRLKNFAKELIEEGNDQKSKFGQRNTTVFSEGAWWHFLFILKFWIDDDSAGFEKTDIAIEKSVNTVFELFENTPLDSVIDFGKFLFQEKFA